jgi:hypothetical protein
MLLMLHHPAGRLGQCRTQRRPSGYRVRPITPIVMSVFACCELMLMLMLNTRTDEDRESKFGKVFSVSGPVVVAEDMVRRNVTSPPE